MLGGKGAEQTTKHLGLTRGTIWVALHIKLVSNFIWQLYRGQIIKIKHSFSQRVEFEELKKGKFGLNHSQYYYLLEFYRSSVWVLMNGGVQANS